jgi:hypothetical protein
MGESKVLDSYGKIKLDLHKKRNLSIHLGKRKFLALKSQMSVVIVRMAFYCSDGDYLGYVKHKNTDDL